jgi:undecaprenyl pyrophosphate phosphatase UppP
MLFENFVFGRRYIFRPRPGAVFLSVVVLILIVLDVFLDLFKKRGLSDFSLYVFSLAIFLHGCLFL